MTTGFIVFAHGSRIEPANEAVRAVARQVARTGGFELVEAAFLELGKPDLAGAVTRLEKKGAQRVVVLPYFLTLGLHLERDLPRIVRDISLAHKQLQIEVAAPLDDHPGLIQILLDRARAALS